MTATSLDALRNGAGNAPVSDDRMEQVRELLLGDHVRRTEARLALLESRVRELELDVGRRLDAMRTRMDAMSGEVAGDQRAAFEELAKAIGDLGERVRRVSRT